MEKRLKLFSIIVLVFVLVFALIIGAFAVISGNDDEQSSSENNDEQSRPQKIDSMLWEHMQTVGDNELIPINIFLSPIDEAELMEKVKIKTGMDPEVYMNDTRFQEEVAGEIARILENSLGYEEAHKVGNETLSEETITAIRSAFSNELKEIAVDAESIIEFSKNDRSLSIVDYTILQVRQKFQAEKNKVLSEEQTAANNLFIESYVNGRNSEVVYASNYTSSVYLKATKSDILYYAQKSEVINIHYDDPKIEIEPM